MTVGSLSYDDDDDDDDDDNDDGDDDDDNDDDDDDNDGDDDGNENVIKAIGALGLRSQGTRRIFVRLKNLTGHFVHTEL